MISPTRDPDPGTCARADLGARGGASGEKVPPPILRSRPANIPGMNAAENARAAKSKQVTVTYSIEEVVREQALSVMELSSHLTFAEALEIAWERVGAHRNGGDE